MANKKQAKIWLSIGRQKETSDDSLGHHGLRSPSQQVKAAAVVLLLLLLLLRRIGSCHHGGRASLYM